MSYFYANNFDIFGVVQQAQRFCEIANYVVNSHFSYARNFILAENTRFRTSQPRKAAFQDQIQIFKLKIYSFLHKEFLYLLLQILLIQFCF